MSWLAIKILAGIFGAAAVLLTLGKLLGTSARMRRRLASSKQFAIRDFPPRRVGRLAGMVVPVGPLLVAPLTGRACVYHRTTVVRTKLETRMLEHRTDVISQIEIVPFAIDDGTGYALVDVTRIELLVENDYNETPRGSDELTPTQAALLAKHDVSPKTFIFVDKTLTFIEAIIEPGERVAAVGLLLLDPVPASEPAANDPYRQTTPEPAKTRAKLMGSPARPLLLTDDQEFAPPLDEA